MCYTCECAYVIHGYISDYDPYASNYDYSPRPEILYPLYVNEIKFTTPSKWYVLSAGKSVITVGKLICILDSHAIEYCFGDFEITCKTHNDEYIIVSFMGRDT